MAKPGKPQQGSAVKVVEALVRPVVEGMDLRLWDVRFEKEGPDWFLRVLIDRDEPLDTDTCEAAVEEAGFLCAFTTEYGKVHPGDDPYLLPRIRVNGGCTPEEFARDISDGQEQTEPTEQ